MRGRPAGRDPGAFGLAALIVVAIAIDARGQAASPEAAAPKAQAKPVPSRPKRPVDDEPVVMSAEAAAKARGKPLADDRYGAEPDWREVPAWRQASFFGIRARGQVFIYVVDCSGSMIDEVPARPGQVRAEAERREPAVAPAIQGDLLQRPALADARRPPQAGRLSLQGPALPVDEPSSSPTGGPTREAPCRSPWR